MALENFVMPGDAAWQLGGMIPSPESREEAGMLFYWGLWKVRLFTVFAFRLRSVCGLHVCRTFGADMLRSYFKQCREELGVRLVEVAFNADGSVNKWWMQFSKRQFMNKSLVPTK